MQVAEILKNKGPDVATIEPSATVAVAVKLLRERGVGALVVTDDDMTIIGILSERDIVRALGLGPRRTLLDQTVGSIMTTEVFTCSLGDRVDALMSLMTEQRTRHLPVEVDGALRGIISIGDVVKHRVSELENEAKAMEDYIHHGR